VHDFSGTEVVQLNNEISHAMPQQTWLR